MTDNQYRLLKHLYSEIQVRLQVQLVCKNSIFSSVLLLIFVKLHVVCKNYFFCVGESFQGAGRLSV